MIGAPLWGRAVDRQGPRIVLLTGLLGYAAATGWFGVAASLATAYVARFVAGAFASGLLPATSALIMRRCPGELRTRHLAWITSASVVGFLVGPALVGWVHGAFVGSRMDVGSALHMTAVPIWTTGVIALATAFGVGSSAGLWRPQDRGAGRSGATTRPSVGIARHRILLLSALGAFGLGAFEVGLSI